jgi:hypothetical protein
MNLERFVTPRGDYESKPALPGPTARPRRRRDRPERRPGGFFLKTFNEKCMSTADNFDNSSFIDTIKHGRQSIGGNVYRV